MSDRVYTVRIQNGVVMMTFDDFTALAGELTNYGVDIEIEPGHPSDQVSFRLKESVREQ